MRTLTKLQTLQSAISHEFVERHEIIGASLTAAVAGQHTVLLGPPGTAKSALIRRLAGCFGLRYWEVLLTRFSTPEDVFGPIKLSALQADKFERACDGYLPGAEVANLEEVFKANPGILNALLAILNEGIFHNGGVAHRVPLVACIASSNELPEGPELDALYDRFMVRLHVPYIADRANFLAMLQAVNVDLTQAVIASSLAVDIRAEQAAAKLVTLDGPIFEAMADTRAASQKAGMSVSDRRWRMSLALVRATAHFDGRTVAEPDDLSILEHCLWREPSERSAVSRMVQSVVNPNGAIAVECLDAANEARRALPEPGTMAKIAYLGALSAANQTFEEIKARLAPLGTGKKVEAARIHVDALIDEMSRLAYTPRVTHARVDA